MQPVKASQATEDCDGGVRSVEPVVLCGHTTISAGSSSVIRVSIPSNASIQSPSANGEGLVITGTGRLRGFVLTQDVPSFGGLTLAGLKPASDAAFIDNIGGRDEDAYDLAAGDYLLYLVTDNSPVEVQLSIEGLPGSVLILPQRQARVEIASPAVTASKGGVYWGGANADLTSTGIALQYISIAYDPAAFVGRFESCLYPGGDSGPSAFGPVCPPTYNRYEFRGGGAAGGLWIRHAPAPLASGRYGLGFNMESAGVPTDIFQVQLWLSFQAI
jgi:hypothetical protein